MARVHSDVKTSKLEVMLGMLPVMRSPVDGCATSTIQTGPTTEQAVYSLDISAPGLLVAPTVPNPPPVMIPDTVDLPTKGTVTELHNVDTTTVTKCITTRSKVPQRVKVLTRTHMERCTVQELETIYRELQNIMQSDKYHESQKLVNEILRKFTDVTIVTPISDDEISAWYRSVLTTNVNSTSSLYSSGVLKMEDWTDEVINLMLNMEAAPDVKVQSLQHLRSNAPWMYLTYLSEFSEDGTPLALAESAGVAATATVPRLTEHSSFKSMLNTAALSEGGESILSRFQRSYDVDKSVASKDNASVRQELESLSSRHTKTDAIRHLLEATLSGVKADPEAIQPLQDELRTEGRRLRHHKQGVTFAYLQGTANAETTAPLYRPMVVNSPMETINGAYTDLDVFLYTLGLDKVGDTRQLDLALCDQPNASHRLRFILMSQSLRMQNHAPANARFVEDMQDKAFYKIHDDRTVSILVEGLWERVNPCTLVNDFSDRFRFTDTAITGDIVHVDRSDVNWDTLNGITIWDAPEQEQENETPATDPNACYANSPEGYWAGNSRSNIMRLIAAEQNTTPDPIEAPRRRIIPVPSSLDEAGPHRSGKVWSRPVKTAQPVVLHTFATGKRWVPPAHVPFHQRAPSHTGYDVHKSSWMGTESSEIKQFQQTLKQLKEGLQGMRYLRRLRAESPALLANVPNDVVSLLDDHDATTAFTNVISSYQTSLQNYKQTRSNHDRKALSGKADEFFTHCGFFSRAAGASNRSMWEGVSHSMTSPARSAPSTSGGSTSSSVWQRDETGAWRTADGRVSQRTSTSTGTNGDWVEIDGVWTQVKKATSAEADTVTSTRLSEGDWTLVNGMWTRVNNATTAAADSTSTADATSTAVTTVSSIGGTLMGGVTTVSHVTPTATANTSGAHTSDDYKLRLMQKIEELCAGINSSADAGTSTEEVTTTLSTASDSVTSGVVTNLETGTSHSLRISPGMKHFQEMVAKSSAGPYTTVKSKTSSHYSVEQV
ncbi:MAG: uncharacterized protein KVP18_003566 [Porospora cf. gigantea A]|nr:MAG: hypothetical protein KVP18_003566 [Porospora cf. gigantea A]